MNIQNKVDKLWNDLFKYMCENYDLDIREICIEVETKDGLTVKKSYKDNQEWLEEAEG